jgi:hypothetical protein
VIGCTLAVPVTVGPGCTGIYLHGNTITTTPYCINVNGPVSTFPALTVQQLTIDGNTLANNGANGAAIKFFAGWTQAPGNQAVVTNNTYSQGGVQIGPGNYFSASVAALCPDLSQITFKGNVWGKPSYYSYQLPQTPPFHSFLVGGDTAPTFYQPCPAGDLQQ